MTAAAPETTPAPAVSAPATPLPPGTCDAHAHVFGPFDRFPSAIPSVYALPEARSRPMPPCWRGSARRAAC